MFIKYFLLAFFTIALRNQDGGMDSQIELVTFIKKNFREEVSVLGFQLLVGVVIMSTIVFSLIKV